MILAIDPGTTISGYVLIRGLDGHVCESGEKPNSKVLRIVRKSRYEPGHIVVIEMMDSYGMPVGASTFKTLVWIGRFLQMAGPMQSLLITRRRVKLHMCGNARATDANIRRTVLDRYPQTGGGKTPEIGIKSNKGPLYGVSGHAIQALAVGITYRETGSLYEYEI